MKDCQICHTKSLAVYYDGRMKGGSMWANMCPKCNNELGVGIGLGVGQMFAWDVEKGRYVKIAG